MGRSKSSCEKNMGFRWWGDGGVRCEEDWVLVGYVYGSGEGWAGLGGVLLGWVKFVGAG